ncbi:YybS family protein [bacterium]|nr:YybS family protein [bacterium]MBU1153680.1 YybS family protein [bacterium]MBU1781993.1 YybS family protein [bacterium]MBU2599551.1 YybS family protein [bacterium]
MKLKIECIHKIQVIYILTLLTIISYILKGSLLFLLLIPLFFSISKVTHKSTSNFFYFLVLVSLFIIELSFKAHFITIFAALGIFTGELVNKKYFAFRVILYSNLLLILLCLIQYLIFSTFFQIMPPFSKVSQEFKDYLSLSLETLFQQLNHQDIPFQEMVEIKGVFNQKAILLYQLLPSSLIIFSIIYNYLNYKFLTILSKHLSYSVNPIKNYACWFFSDYIILGFLSSWLFYLIFKSYNFQILFLVILNIWYFFQFLYLIYGFSIVSFFLNKFNLPIIIKIFSFLLLFLTSGMVMFLGVFDTWFDFRKLRKITK